MGPRTCLESCGKSRLQRLELNTGYMRCQLVVNLRRRCTNPLRLVTRANIFCVLAPNIFGIGTAIFLPHLEKNCINKLRAEIATYHSGMQGHSTIVSAECRTTFIFMRPEMCRWLLDFSEIFKPLI